jgi:hypothetical protein
LAEFLDDFPTVVSKKSKPASSAALSSAPLLRVFQPRDRAVCTMCPGSTWARPFGVPWSNSTNTGGGVGTEALSHELEDGRHLIT